MTKTITTRSRKSKQDAAKAARSERAEVKKKRSMGQKSVEKQLMVAIVEACLLEKAKSPKKNLSRHFIGNLVTQYKQNYPTLTERIIINSVQYRLKKIKKETHDATTYSTVPREIIIADDDTRSSLTNSKSSTLSTDDTNPSSNSRTITDETTATRARGGRPKDSSTIENIQKQKRDYADFVNEVSFRFSKEKEKHGKKYSRRGLLDEIIKQVQEDFNQPTLGHYFENRIWWKFEKK